VNRHLLPVLALIIYLFSAAPYLGQWDSFDYLKQIVTHQLSDLGVGRPVFIAYNVALWEGARWLFGLAPRQVEHVAMIAAVLLGALGILLFDRLARRMLPARPARMAALALVASPIYSVYSGYIMTEVPMLAASLAAALLLWADKEAGSARDLAAGLCFGLAVGIREQALTLAGAYVWILWTRRTGHRARLRSLGFFSIASGVVILAPVAALYWHNPGAFEERMRTWLGAIPMQRIHFLTNIEASVLYTLAIAPASWIALAAAGASKLRVRKLPPGGQDASIASPIWGILCCLVFPVAALWRDADVQIHPRYLLIVLPAVLILCAEAYHRWLPSARATVGWAIFHVAVFAMSWAAMSPYRQLQWQKVHYARQVVDAVPGAGLFVAGSYSPVFDYHRGIGERPEWRVLWSGWGWNRKRAENGIREAWRENLPVYFCDGPLAWIFLEGERLDLYPVLTESEQREVFAGLLRLYPRHEAAGNAGKQ
jgi:4-amino-4-deoxy-L-arabinose transferase-like glycosyltransferase